MLPAGQRGVVRKAHRRGIEMRTKTSEGYFEEGYKAGKDEAQAELTRLREKVERLQEHIRSESSRLVQIDASRNKAEAELTRLREELRRITVERDLYAMSLERHERDTLLAALKEIASDGWTPESLDDQSDEMMKSQLRIAVAIARTAISKVEGEK